MYKRLGPLVFALAGLAAVSSTGMKLMQQEHDSAKSAGKKEANQSPSEPKSVPKLVAMNERVAKRVNALRPCVKQRLNRVVKKLPNNVTLLVTSAYRTRQEQASLRSTFGVKARPGTSTHEDGRAVDVNVFVNGARVPPKKQNRIIGKVMASEGFRYLGPIDPVHYSVPKWEIDTTISQVPDLQLGTYAEFLEIQRQALANVKPDTSETNPEGERVALDKSSEATADTN